MTDDPDAEPTPAERAALEAARAAKKARKAQEKADRLAAEYRRLHGRRPGGANGDCRRRELRQTPRGSTAPSGAARRRPPGRRCWWPPRPCSWPASRSWSWPSWCTRATGRARPRPLTPALRDQVLLAGAPGHRRAELARLPRHRPRPGPLARRLDRSAALVLRRRDPGRPQADRRRQGGDDRADPRGGRRLARPVRRAGAHHRQRRAHGHPGERQGRGQARAAAGRPAARRRRAGRSAGCNRSG